MGRHNNMLSPDGPLSQQNIGSMFGQIADDAPSQIWLVKVVGASLVATYGYQCSIEYLVTSTGLPSDYSPPQYFDPVTNPDGLTFTTGKLLLAWQAQTIDGTTEYWGIPIDQNSGFFARLLTSGTNSNSTTGWNLQPQDLADGAWADIGSPTTGHTAIPLTIDGTNFAYTPISGLRVWVIPSANDSGYYGFLPLGPNPGFFGRITAFSFPTATIQPSHGPGGDYGSTISASPIPLFTLSGPTYQYCNSYVNQWVFVIPIVGSYLYMPIGTASYQIPGMFSADVAGVIQVCGSGAKAFWDVIYVGFNTWGEYESTPATAGWIGGSLYSMAYGGMFNGSNSTVGTFNAVQIADNSSSTQRINILQRGMIDSNVSDSVALGIGSPFTPGSGYETYYGITQQYGTQSSGGSGLTTNATFLTGVFHPTSGDPVSWIRVVGSNSGFTFLPGEYQVSDGVNSYRGLSLSIFDQSALGYGYTGGIVTYDSLGVSQYPPVTTGGPISGQTFLAATYDISGNLTQLSWVEGYSGIGP
jgi:hypothetical protein